MTRTDLMAGFHAEWATYGRHRVCITVRDGFPSDYEHEIARMVARVLDNEDPAHHSARLHTVFNNDTYSALTVHIGTTEPDDMPEIQASVDLMLRLFWPDENLTAIIEAVAPGNTSSDHYHHMEHITRQSYRDEEGRQ